MTIDNTLRHASTQDLILVSIVERLRDQIGAYNDQNCWATDDPVPRSHPGGDEFCTVCFGDGAFPMEFFAGAGDNTLTEAGSVIISPTILVRGDRRHRRERRLTGTDLTHNDERKSLIRRKRDILKALFADDNWEPNAPSGSAGVERPLLRDIMSPKNATQPGDVRVAQADYIQSRIIVATVFDWDLS